MERGFKAIEERWEQGFKGVEERWEQGFKGVEERWEQGFKGIEERWERGFSAGQLAMLTHRLSRNFLPNDVAAIHKHIMATWRAGSASTIAYKDLLESGFRVFSQNDEDGILLRIFSHIGQTNQYVVEIGSNCSDSTLVFPKTCPQT